MLLNKKKPNVRYSVALRDQSFLTVTHTLTHKHTYYHHHHSSPPLIHLPHNRQADRQTDRCPPLTAFKVSFSTVVMAADGKSYSACHCHSCLPSCYSLNISVLKFSSRWSVACTFQCCLQVQLALTTTGFIYLSVDVPVCACICVFVCMGFCVLEIRLALTCKVICLSPVSAVRSGKMIRLNKIA